MTVNFHFYIPHSVFLIPYSWIVFWCLTSCAAWPAGAEESRSKPGLANPFFAMNFASYDKRISSSPEAQAEWLRELDYAGCQYLGPLEGLREVEEAMDAHGQRTADLHGRSPGRLQHPGRSGERYHWLETDDEANLDRLAARSMPHLREMG